MSSVLNSFIILFLPFVCVFLFYSFDIAKSEIKDEGKIVYEFSIINNSEEIRKNYDRIITKIKEIN